MVLTRLRSLVFTRHFIYAGVITCRAAPLCISRFVSACLAIDGRCSVALSLPPPSHALSALFHVRSPSSFLYYASPVSLHSWVDVWWMDVFVGRVAFSFCSALQTGFFRFSGCWLSGTRSSFTTSRFAAFACSHCARSALATPPGTLTGRASVCFSSPPACAAPFWNYAPFHRVSFFCATLFHSPRLISIAFALFCVYVAGSFGWVSLVFVVFRSFGGCVNAFGSDLPRRVVESDNGGLKMDAPLCARHLAFCRSLRVASLISSARSFVSV